MNFIDKLSAAWTDNNSLLCVGLDPDLARFPARLQGQPDAIFTFCKAIIDATADLACSFKPQIAYFAALGAEAQLEAICHYARTAYPRIPLILDAKRGDIGATAHQYAREAYDRYGADAVTVSPYMGFDSVEPYLEWSERGVIVLCRTSNAGGSDLQFLDVGGKPLYQHVARLVAEQWNRNGQCALVVGATFPDELAQVRAAAGHSLGEYAALVAAGVLQFDDAVGLVAERAAAMADAGDLQPGSMVAMLGGDDHAVRALADRLGLTVANDNAPGQLVLSGAVEAIDQAEELARDETGARARRLQVSAAFHSPLMQPAAARLATALAQVEIGTPHFPVYANGTAAPFTDVRRELSENLLRAVRWRETMLALRAAGIERYVEHGPGAVLTGLVKRTLAAA